MLQVAINSSASDPLDDTLPVMGEEPSHSEHIQDPERYTSVECNKSSFLIPAGFHTMIKTDGAEYQTSNKSVHADQAVVEWHERILL
ncbi:hypothetical protein F4604DRAFT_1913383 [Suillus subluteus]|nr:hypothetical protein F4604DRAFT_1913383 [Suillus subluteus]